MGRETMTKEQFKAWRGRVGFTVKEAAAALGCSFASAKGYSDGRREIPLYVLRLCKYIERYGPIDGAIDEAAS